MESVTRTHARKTASMRRLLLVRASRIARALFYVVTVSAALASVIATNASDGTGPWLSEWSWYLLMGGLVLFAVMLLIQAWLVLRQHRVDDPAVVPAVSVEAVRRE
ncbi:MAG: hypothetical protein J0H69_10660 [Burkholderiales bacterium]|nr:hypothetical protein [Burkholderiales bacterium]